MLLSWLPWSRSAVFTLILVPFLTSFLADRSLAACTNDPATAQAAANFVSNPSSLLNGPNGSPSIGQITDAVRDYVAANPQALAAVIGLLKAGGLTADQQKAIGSGLGLAAGLCIRPDPTFAAEIQTQIAGTDSADAKTAYAAVTGNQLIGGVGGGGGGGGGGSPGSAGGGQTAFPTPTGNSTLQAFTANSVSNTPTNFFSSGGAVSAGSITTSTTATNVVCVVSVTC